MSTEQTDWQRVRAMFEQALELPPADRATFLDTQCAGQPELRAEVEALLAADEQANAQPRELVAAAPALLQALAEDQRRVDDARLTGMRAGAWRLLREIGRGGMGTVYLAQRDDGAYTQQAAVKLLRADWPGSEMDRRLEAERQILAGLDHPGIARLLDGGSNADGRPFLVLDYVDGLPIGRWCDERQLGINERIRLFLQVCAAVAYAHRCLVVHRDLKPSNILVTTTGQVKLLDFGIAKLLQGVGDASTQTLRSFTPEYASPEQVSGAPITTGVDVHALGLLLYELLTGKRAFGQSDSTPAAYEQAILHEQALAPSRAAGEGADATDRASRCRLTPTALTARLRGDLDAIVAKALRKEPEQRYASVEALADDLNRHLALEPVQARRGAWRYRSGRFLRRHALATAFATLALIAVLAGSAFSLWQASIARAERDRAQIAATTAEAVTNFLTQLLAKATPDAGKGKELSVRDALDLAATDLDKKFADQPEVRARVQMLLGNVYTILGDYEKADVQLRAGLEVIVKLHGESSMEVTDALSLLANNLRKQGALDEANEVISHAHAIATKAIGANAEQTLWLLSDVGLIAYERGEYNDAAKAFAAALDGMRKLPDANPRAIANVLHNHAAALTRAERYDDAEAAHLESLAIRRSLFTDPHTNIATGLHQLGVTKAAQKQYVEAARYFSEARAQYVILVGPEDENVLIEDLALARLEVDQGRFDAATTLLQPLLERHRKLLGNDHEDTAICAVELADALQHTGQNAAAQELISPAITVLEQAYPNGHNVLAAALRVQLALQRDRGQPDCALAERIFGMLLRSYGPTHSKVRAAQAAASECASGA